MTRNSLECGFDCDGSNTTLNTGTVLKKPDEASPRHSKTRRTNKKKLMKRMRIDDFYVFRTDRFFLKFKKNQSQYIHV